jgi:hypothetical protein
MTYSANVTVYTTPAGSHSPHLTRRRTRARSALPRPLYPPCCHLQPPPARARRKEHYLQVEGLPPRTHDLHALALADREPPDFALGIKQQPIELRHFNKPLRDGREGFCRREPLDARRPLARWARSSTLDHSRVAACQAAPSWTPSGQVTRNRPRYRKAS